MRTNKVLSLLLGSALVIVLSPATGSPRKARLVMSPFHKQIGPRALPAGVAGSHFGLFGCQIVNLNDGEPCYDPFQMQHAYNVDTLINAGFNGKGRTIVIVDAFQSPNIVKQLDVWNTFYGLPAFNVAGGPTFPQIAPDGLTPFVPGDENMTGWAEEISLDVLWAHSIAPG